MIINIQHSKRSLSISEVSCYVRVTIIMNSYVSSWSSNNFFFHSITGFNNPVYCKQLEIFDFLQNYILKTIRWWLIKKKKKMNQLTT